MKTEMSTIHSNSYLVSTSNVVTDVGNGFLELTGYLKNEIISKEISEIFVNFLRLPYDTFKQIKLDDKLECFIFTKALEAREVIISIELNSNLNIYYINEKPNLKIESKFLIFNKLINDNHLGIGIYCCPDLRLLKANQKYLSFMQEPFNKVENILGLCLKDFIVDFKGSEFEGFWLDVIRTGENLYLKEVKGTSEELDTRYWDNTLIPSLEDGKVKYIISINNDMTDRVLHRMSIEEQKEQLEADTNASKNRRNKLAYAFERIRELVHSTLDFDDLMKGIIFEASKGINCDSAAISIKQGDKWVISYTYGLSNNKIGSTMNDEEEPHALLAIQTRKPVVIEDTLNDDRVNLEHIKKWGIRSVVVVPLLTECHAIGVIFFNYYNKATHFYKSDIEFAQNLAITISMALKNVKLYEKVCTELAVQMEAKKIINHQQEQLLTIEKEKNEALKREIEMKDEFLSLISHEFKTPLTVINSAIQAMNLICRGELSDKGKRFLNKIQQSSNRQLKLVNNLLDITRINADYLEINRKNIDIVLLTSTIVESIKIISEQKGVSLSFVSTLSKKVIGLDDEKYERILLNLLSNAIKFTPEGKLVSVKVSLKLVRGKYNVCIQVKDTGIGIPFDKKELIFERFGQVDSSLSRNAEGTGIGLHLVKMLVEKMDGEILLESSVGKGSTFTILLPSTKEKKAPIVKSIKEISDSRLIQATAIEFSDIYL